MVHGEQIILLNALCFPTGLLDTSATPAVNEFFLARRLSNGSMWLFGCGSKSGDADLYCGQYSRLYARSVCDTKSPLQIVALYECCIGLCLTRIPNSALCEFPPP